MSEFLERCRRSAWTCGALVLLLGSSVAHAARIDGLYGAEADLPGGRTAGLAGAFDAALGAVLLKVTGNPEAAAARRSLFPDPAAIVQQYSALPDNRVQVDFSPEAVRAALDKAGLPVWSEDRPLVAVWFAVDAGRGNRYIVSDGTAGATGALGQSREALIASAAARGLPIVLPLNDAEDLARVSSADIWGDFREPVIEASRRYGAEAILIGRARSVSTADRGVRWTLLANGQQAAWQGDVAAGPAQAAAVLAGQLATTADSAGVLRLRVIGVNSLESYGRLNQYLRSLGIVEQAGVARVDGDVVEFDLVVRGGPERLRSELNSSRLLAAALQADQQLEQQSEQQADRPAGRPADFVYAWAEAP
jgi:hypothetical protein